MRFTVLTGLTMLAVSTTVHAQQPTPQALVRRAVDAMGGERALRDVATVSTDFNSASFGLGQEETPLSPARGPIAAGRIFTDWRGVRRVQMQEIRQVTGVLTRQRQVVSVDIGMAEVNGVQNPMGPGAVAAALQGMRLQPDRILLRALDNPATVTRIPAKTWRGELMDGVRFASGADTMALYFDRVNGLLTVSEVTADDAILGDRHGVTWYTRWQDAGGVKFPRQFDSETNGRLVSQNIVTGLWINQPLSDTLFAIPDSIAARAQRAAPVAPTLVVNLVELAPGVWRAEGSTHHTLVVDQGTQLVLVEAPQSAARMRAVLDTLSSRFKAKPIGLVIATHHHWDHTGGLRATMAAGHRVAAHRRNVGFIQGIGAAKKTVVPDALSRGKAKVVVAAIDDSLVVGTGDRRVVMYHLPNSHAEGLLVAHVPGARILFTSDVVNPPVPPAATPLSQVGSAELVAMVRARGLAVDRYAGGHGPTVSWMEIERAANPR